MALAASAGTFAWSNPATISWGPGCVEAQLVSALDRLGARRVMVVTTRSTRENPAVYGRVAALLGPRLAGTALITQHAPIEEVAAGARESSSAQPDAIVSVGGGSAVDAAKVIAFALATGLDLGDEKALAGASKLQPDRMLPHLAVPTTLSVAELSSSAGVTTRAHDKGGMASRALIPAQVFYDAALAAHTPAQLWLSTGIRAVDHAVETVLADGEHPLPDVAALDALGRLQRSLRRIKDQPGDLAARTENQLGAWLSYLAPALAARGPSHMLGKSIGARHGIPHGVTSCLLLPHVLRARFAATADRQPRIAGALGARDGESAADAVARLVADLGLPRHLREFGLSEQDLAAAAEATARNKELRLGRDEFLAILRAAA